MNTTTLDSPLGPLTLIGGPNGLAGLRFWGRAPRLDEARPRPAELADVAAQLDDYFAGKHRLFELRLDLHGTPFQRLVWSALQAIPFGATVSYSELTRELGRDSSDHEQVRRVAAAIGRTPIPVILPCHRVLAANGDLTGGLAELEVGRDGRSVRVGSVHEHDGVLHLPVPEVGRDDSGSQSRISGGGMHGVAALQPRERLALAPGCLQDIGDPPELARRLQVMRERVDDLVDAASLRWQALRGGR